MRYDQNFNAGWDNLPAMEESVYAYLAELNSPRCQPIKPAELKKLMPAVRRGNKKAESKIILANLRFVVQVANEYKNRGVPLADLIAEGNTGLIEALRRFDETRGFKFISYAVWWIRQAILQCLSRNASIVHLPLNRGEMLRRIEKFIKNYQHTHEGRSPGKEEISKEFDLSREQIEDLMANRAWTVSLDAPSVGGDEDAKLIEVFSDQTEDSPDKKLEQSNAAIKIEDVLQTIDGREAEVLRLYFGLGGEDPHTLEEIGKQYNLTRERIRQIKEKALRGLRHPKRRVALESLLDK